ncbi:DUF305 domain-containing protein [Agromyces sp. CFH 90414]|uniref:DUF305 domain-containing protein n=1 Tax=Agromyces agglutinans TaxID=2662258 RepID=A0A6I2F6G4_9MICO|nr:DUF305 domain-containing protein [Agromyces agglutinans]MRG59347.1 DUF305 domain-containing protein [Agromyces agglutinans]
MTGRRRARHLPLAGVLGIAGLLALAGCATAAGDATGSGDGHGAHGGASEPADASDASVEASDADVMFAQMMIPHHEQALEMSAIVLAKPGLDAEVANLAGQIEAAQGPEIAQLEGWLEEWGAPREMPEGHGHEMDGMLSAEDLAALEAADSAAASTRFLEQMIAHHEGAVAMAEEQLESGTHQGALELARSIVDSQTDEIERMRGLLEG